LIKTKVSNALRNPRVSEASDGRLDHWIELVPTFQIQSTTMKILISDHHQLFRAGLRLLLEPLKEGMAFGEVGTFDELVDQCRDGGRYDLILMDLRMPGWPGFEGIGAVRALQPDTPLVVVSVSEDGGDIRQAFDHGVDGYIPKSSSSAVLRGALDLVLSGGVYVPPMALHVSPEPPERHREPEDEHRGSRRLSPRQHEVLTALCTGKSNKQIAYELGLSEGTVKIHVTAVFKSFGVRNRTQAVIVAQAGAS
jgi:DNA-binding NarL/FixJ family response regulator